MKLAMLAPIAWRTPPKHYGPWESIASLLTEGLVSRGVDVTLFATLDSVTAAALDGVCPHGYAEDAQLDGRVWEALHVSHALARSGEFELVHNHLDEGVTGYLAHDIESSVGAVRAAIRLDRSVVHARVVALFGADRMAEDYLRTYGKQLTSAR